MNPANPEAGLRNPEFYARIRRLEALGFKSFPSDLTYFDGTWAIRETAGHAARRINSVTPVDPNDHGDMENRIHAVSKRFSKIKKDAVFRITPLAPRKLIEWFETSAWISRDESMVMRLDLEKIDFGAPQDQTSLSDIESWVKVFLRLSEKSNQSYQPSIDVISSIPLFQNLFVQIVEDNEVCALRTVQDGEFVGIFDVVTDHNFRRRGHARYMLESILMLVKAQKAKFAWLQVEVENVAAVALYQKLGFQEVYRYEYFSPPTQNDR